MRFDSFRVTRHAILAPLAMIVVLWAAPLQVSAADEDADTSHAAGQGDADHNHADGEHATNGHDAHAGEGGSHEEGPHDNGHGGVDYNKPPLDFNLALFLWSLILFAGFVFVARKFAWHPLIVGLNAREARVTRALADAEAARIGAEKLLTDHQARMDQVTEEVKGIVAQARTQAEQEKTRILAEAEAEAHALRDKALADIEAARQQALGDLDLRIERQVAVATDHLLTPTV